MSHTEWNRIQEQTRSGRALRFDARTAPPLERSIDISVLPKNAVTFPWLDAKMVAIICPCPGCSVGVFIKYHPLRRDRALDHFNKHGLDVLDNQHVVHLFGYRGLYISSPESRTY